MHLPWKRFLFVLVLVLLDQWSKSAVFEHLDPARVMHDAPEGYGLDIHGHRRWVLVDPYFSFMLSLNPGAAFGRFGDYPHLLIWGRVLAVLGLTWFAWKLPTRPWFMSIAVVLVLAGALGNLVDNFWTGPMQDGHPYGLVRDFLDVWFVSADSLDASGEASGWGWDYHFPTFNVADSCITVGAILWILGSFLFGDPLAKPKEGNGNPTEETA